MSDPAARTGLNPSRQAPGFSDIPTIGGSLLPILVNKLSLQAAAQGNSPIHGTPPVQPKTGNDRRMLLEEISCKIDRPDITVIMGPNGAGKSLLLRCMTGIETPTSGSIEIAGGNSSEALRKQFSFVFQTPVMLRRTVLANLRFVARQRGITDDEACHMLLRQVGLDGLEQQPARLLSGGEKQRLALARALLTRPKILFLDEATANLDPASVDIIEQIITETSSSGTKIIMVTHDIGQARRLAGSVIFMARGRICEHTDAGRFFSNPQSPEAVHFLQGRLVI